MSGIAFIIITVLAGIGTATGYIAFITLIGIFPVLIPQPKKISYTKMVQALILIGALLGNLINLYLIRLPLGVPLLIVITLFGGIFIGCKAAAISEVINIFPILRSRLSITRGFSYLLIALALGKMIGSLIQFLIL